MEDRSAPIIIQQEFNLPISEVWPAITEQPQMIVWFFEDIPEFRPEVGFSTRFNVTTPNRDFMHQWTISKVTPGSRIVYDWSYEGMQGLGKVVFELSEVDGKTTLVLTNTGLESFPDDLPEFTRESCIGGWTYFINERLSDYLSSE